MQAILFLGQTILATLFIAAGATKLVDIEVFALTLSAVGIFSHHKKLLRLFALVVPISELIIGFASIIGFYSMLINSLLLFLICCFIVIHLIALAKRIQVTCRCFGAFGSSKLGVEGLIHNLVLALLALCVLWGGQIYQPVHDTTTPVLYILIVVGYILFALVAAQASIILTRLKEETGV